MAKDPDDRYQSGESLLADLRRLAAQPGAAFAVATDQRAVQPIGPTILVGRDQEVISLGTRWLKARAGAGGAAIVEGPAGAGKTRLVRELTTAVATDGDLVLYGKCVPDDPVPLAPLRAAVERYLRTVERLPPAERDQAVQRLRRAAGRGGPLLRTLSPLLAELVQAPEIGEHDRHEQFINAVAAFLVGLADEFQGAVLHIDDVQWLDGSDPAGAAAGDQPADRHPAAGHRDRPGRPGQPARAGPVRRRHGRHPRHPDPAAPAGAGGGGPAGRGAPGRRAAARRAGRGAGRTGRRQPVHHRRVRPRGLRRRAGRTRPGAAGGWTWPGWTASSCPATRSTWCCSASTASARRAADLLAAGAAGGRWFPTELAAAVCGIDPRQARARARRGRGAAAGDRHRAGRLPVPARPDPGGAAGRPGPARRCDGCTSASPRSWTRPCRDDPPLRLRDRPALRARRDRPPAAAGLPAAASPPAGWRWPSTPRPRRATSSRSPPRSAERAGHHAAAGLLPRAGRELRADRAVRARRCSTSTRRCAPSRTSCAGPRSWPRWPRCTTAPGARTGRSTRSAAGSPSWARRCRAAGSALAAEHARLVGCSGSSSAAPGSGSAPPSGRAPGTLPAAGRPVRRRRVRLDDADAPRHARGDEPPLAVRRSTGSARARSTPGTWPASA